jgi:hypothetical protein
MANLLNQNIGTNYKGILNLNTLNGNLSGTLQAVTDGDGNASPLQLSTTAVSVANSFSIVKGGRTLNIVPNESGLSGTAIFTTSGVLALGAANAYTTYLDTSGNFVIGHTTASARLHVRGDGTNPILRLENGAGAQVASVNNAGDLNAREIGASVGFFAPNSTEVRGTYIRARASTFLNFSDGTQGILIDSASGTSASASAILQANSTTKGFLPPRMTTTQVNAIASPATGLVVYSTTENALCLYNGSSWRKLNDSPL